MRILIITIRLLWLIWVVFTLWLGLLFRHSSFLIGALISSFIGLYTVRYFSAIPHSPPVFFNPNFDLHRLFHMLFSNRPHLWAFILLLSIDLNLGFIVFNHELFKKIILESKMNSLFFWFVPGVTTGFLAGWSLALFRWWNNRNQLY